MFDDLDFTEQAQSLLDVNSLEDILDLWGIDPVFVVALLIQEGHIDEFQGVEEETEGSEAE